MTNRQQEVLNTKVFRQGQPPGRLDLGPYPVEGFLQGDFGGILPGPVSMPKEGKDNPI